MTTIITSNGSKWAGEEPDPIELLIHRLETETLHPRFEKYGNFLMLDDEPAQPEGWRHFWGNFYTVSGVFDVRTDDPELIERLTSLIRANQATEAYATAKREIAEGDAYWERRERERYEARERDRVREARAVVARDRARRAGRAS